MLCVWNANPAMCDFWLANLVIYEMWAAIQPVCELQAVSSEAYSEPRQIFDGIGSWLL